MRVIAVLVGVLVAMCAAAEETSDNFDGPSVEILGVKIVRGMPVSQVRAAFPGLHCAEEEPLDPIFDHCSVSDGVPPGADGAVTFKEGRVYSASRNWFIPESAEPL